MKEIRYLMSGKIPERKAGFIALPPRPQLERFWWQENVVSLCLVPPSWAGTRRLTDYVHRMGEEAEGLWIAPELEAYFPGWKQPLLEPESAAFLLRQQPFRETVVILTGGDAADCDKRYGGAETDRETAAAGRYCAGSGSQVPDIRWLERFLEDIFSELNGLYLVGAEPEEELESVLDWICEQSGLVACVTQRMPETDGRRTAVVDLRRNEKVPVRKIGPGSLYLDLTSESEKQRVLKQKRTDISYISARNYLDTVCKARYNAI